MRSIPLPCIFLLPLMLEACEERVRLGTWQEPADSGFDAGDPTSDIDGGGRVDSGVADAGLADGGRGNIAALGLAWTHSCAVSERGTVFCWGENDRRQLGNGSQNNSPLPVPIPRIADATPPMFVAGLHGCTNTLRSAVMCWGANVYGELGNGMVHGNGTPVEVIGLHANVAQLVGGAYFSCARLTTGEVWCWGHNSGTLGDGTAENRTTPVKVRALNARWLGAGQGHTCAVDQVGAAWCWGDNNSGELGDGTLESRLVPTPVAGLDAGVRSISGGFNHSCALMEDGGILCWGDNRYGALGDGTTFSRPTPGPVRGLPQAAREVTAGEWNTCAVTHGGAVYCWGYDGYRLGIGSGDDPRVPVPVVGLDAGFESVRLGRFGGCALRDDQRAFCWGYNGRGWLGDGTYDDAVAPIPLELPDF